MSLVANTLSLSNDATTVNLTPYLDNTDSQNLSLTTPIVGTNRTINISNGTNVTFDVADNDNNSTNEIQDLLLATNTLSLTGDATPVNLAPYLDNTDNQDLSLAGNTLSLTNDATPINLAPYLDNTDNQDLILTGNTLSLTNDGTPINLAPYLDNTDSQNLGNVLGLGNNAGAIKITNLGAPTLGTDATTKTYVDNTVATAIATNFAFKVNYTFTNAGVPVINQPIVLGAEDFDDFNVVSANQFTVPANGAGFYIFYVDGSSSNTAIALKLRVNSSALYPVKRQTSWPDPLKINDLHTVMLKLSAGDVVDLVVDSRSSLEQVTGVFFGNKL